MQGKGTLDSWLNQFRNDAFQSPPSNKRRRTPTTPNGPFDDNDTQQLNLNELEDDENDYGTVNFDIKRKATDKRASKTWYNMKSNFKPDAYDFTAIPPKESTISTKDLSRHVKHLADMLINGNLRIKFSPKCATREGAKRYCQTKLDDRGYPRFKLIGTNATDPFGNSICDMNGDKVDDIIICDKQGNPVIINGYKLVQASPFKKVWMNAKASGTTQLSFESWLAQQFNTTKDWEKLTNNDWQNGKISWDLSKATTEAQNAYNTYNNLGLGKPRLNTRLSPRALWSSLFSEFIWVGVKYVFQDSNKTIAALINCVNYLKLANAMFVITIEKQAADHAGKPNWIDWFNYKQSNTKLTKQQLGSRVQQLYITLKQESEVNANKETVGETTEGLIKNTINVIKASFNVNANKTQLEALCDKIDNQTASVSQINQLKEMFKNGVDKVVNNQFPGYLSYVKQSIARKPKAVDDFDNYMEMKWKDGEE